MPRTLDLEKVRGAPGVRLVALGVTPSPWSQAARGILHVKRLDYALCKIPPASPEVESLGEWTGQRSAPVLLFEDEPIRTGWAEILLLAERVAPEPRLIPEDPRERALLFGMAHELAGEMGLGWARRLEMVHAMVGRSDAPLPPLATKYGYRRDEADAAPERSAAVLRLFSRQLAEQRAAGRRFLLGDRLTALDLYWAVFSHLVAPLPRELCPLPEALRPVFQARDSRILAELDPALLAHRDRIYHDHLELPVDL